MRFQKIIRKLQDEREALDQLIACLEQVRSAGPEKQDPVRKRRGRTFMAAAERMQVSERMRKYWAARRMSKLEAGVLYPDAVPPQNVTHTAASAV